MAKDSENVWNPTTGRWESKKKAASDQPFSDTQLAYLMGFLGEFFRRAIADHDSEAESQHLGMRQAKPNLRSAVSRPTETLLKAHPEYAEMLRAAACAPGSPISAEVRKKIQRWTT